MSVSPSASGVEGSVVKRFPFRLTRAAGCTAPSAESADPTSAGQARQCKKCFVQCRSFNFQAVDPGTSPGYTEEFHVDAPRRGRPRLARGQPGLPERGPILVGGIEITQRRELGVDVLQVACKDRSGREDLRQKNRTQAIVPQQRLDCRQRGARR